MTYLGNDRWLHHLDRGGTIELGLEDIGVISKLQPSEVEVEVTKGLLEHLNDPTDVEDFSIALEDEYGKDVRVMFTYPLTYTRGVKKNET
jgi:hypothetical protein